MSIKSWWWKTIGNPISSQLMCDDGIWYGKDTDKSIAPSFFNVKYGRYAGMCSDQNGKSYTFDILGILENKNYILCTNHIFYWQ